jgi:hypothetical protein
MCAQDIKEYMNDRLTHVFDCIPEGKSSKICAATIASSGGVYSTLLPMPDKAVKDINERVKKNYTLAYTYAGEYFRIRKCRFPRKAGGFAVRRILLGS